MRLRSYIHLTSMVIFTMISIGRAIGEEALKYYALRTLIVLILVGVILKISKKLTILTFTDEEKATIASNVKDANRCDICGNDFVDLGISSSFSRVCSIKCSLVSSKKGMELMLYGLLAFSLYDYNISILPTATIFLILAIIGIESDTPELRMRYENTFDGEMEDLLENITRTILDEDEEIQDGEYDQKITMGEEGKTLVVNGDEYLICCFQTARLGESYCYCGRAIPEKLKNYVSSQVGNEVTIDNSLK